jgi:pyrimidine operon attenuation protein / uracil phosphoribosyltransferase
MENRILILDKQRIARKLQRMAYQVWEHNSKETEITLLGVEGAGLALARDLAKRVESISPLKTEVISIKVDKKDPLSREIELGKDLSGKSVILVDDVANSGKTLLYAMKPLLSFVPRKILIAVLVDRTHKSFPVYPDIVGHSVATTLQEHIEVVCEGESITAAYLH